jgi:hypothetical protein
MCADSFRYAELNTGFSQNLLLDSISDLQYAAFFPQERYDTTSNAEVYYGPRKWPISSRLSFAVIVGSPIYLEMSLQGSSAIPEGQSMPILHNVVEKIHYDNNDMRNRVDLTAMVHNLLDHGADIHAQYEGLTPFQALFRCIVHPWEIDFRILIESIQHFAELFLQHGSDPNADVFCLGGNIEIFAKYPAMYISKPLRAALYCPDMVQMLLHLGANFDGLSEKGRPHLTCVYYMLHHSLQTPWMVLKQPWIL